MGLSDSVEGVRQDRGIGADLYERLRDSDEQSHFISDQSGRDRRQRPTCKKMRQEKQSLGVVRIWNPKAVGRKGRRPRLSRRLGSEKGQKGTKKDLTCWT